MIGHRAVSKRVEVPVVAEVQRDSGMLIVDLQEFRQGQVFDSEVLKKGRQFPIRPVEIAR